MKIGKGIKSLTMGLVAAIGLGVANPQKAEALDVIKGQNEVQMMETEYLNTPEGQFFTTSLGKKLMGDRGEHMLIKGSMHQMTAVKFYEMVTETNVTGYPPGITNSKYSGVLKQAWDARKDRAKLFKFVGIDSIKKRTSPITSEMLRNEPAVYLLASFLYDNCDEYAREFGLNSSDPMFQFAKGISKYTSAYIFGIANFPETRNVMNLRDDIEVPFLNAIFLSAGYDAGLDDYFRGNKQEVLNKTLGLLQRKGEREQLIAAWASIFLANYYNFNSSTISTARIVHNKMTLPLRDMNYQIRPNPNTPPFYYDSEGKFKF